MSNCENHFCLFHYRLAAETSGVFAKQAIKLVKAIGSKITEVTQEKWARVFYAKDYQ